MSIIFSRQCEYALQAVMYLAIKQDDEMITIKELTRKLHIPYHFLAKILQKLTHKKLLRSHKGPYGGFTLAMSPRRITLFQIIEAVDGIGFTQQCLLGFKECSQTNPCALHDQWKTSREEIVAILTGKNIEEMASKMMKPQYKR